jgi:SAM-dependent methyltransferase
MVRQATRRNAVAVETGLAELLCASAERIPYPADSFDKVYAINSLQFSADLPRALQEIGRVLKPAGVVSVAVQPRLPGATERRVDAVDAALQSSLREAGFSSLTRERKMMKPVSCVCVMAAKPADFGAPRIGAIQTGQRTAGQARAGEATAAEATAAEAEPRQTEARRAGAGQAEAGQAGSGRTRAAAPRR